MFEGGISSLSPSGLAGLGCCHGLANSKKEKLTGSHHQSPSLYLKVNTRCPFLQDRHQVFSLEREKGVSHFKCLWESSLLSLAPCCLPAHQGAAGLLVPQDAQPAVRSGCCTQNAMCTDPSRKAKVFSVRCPGTILVITELRLHKSPADIQPPKSRQGAEIQRNPLLKKTLIINWQNQERSQMCLTSKPVSTLGHSPAPIPLHLHARRDPWMSEAEKPFAGAGYVGADE